MTIKVEQTDIIPQPYASVLQQRITNFWHPLMPRGVAYYDENYHTLNEYQGMKITIREITESDYPTILSLIKELATFEKAPEKVTNTVAQMVREKDYFNCFVAETAQKQVIGMALYFFAYYTWSGKSLYLDDLYVKDSFRGQGIGTQLLEKIVSVARDKGCSKVRLQVLDWNEQAINLYKKCGATVDAEWSNCYFDV